MRRRTIVECAAAGALLAAGAHAQRIWTLTGLPGVLEENATTGALLSAYPLPAPVAPFAAPDGDLSVDRETGTLWITDGGTIFVVARTGGPPLVAFPVPPPFGPLSGLAYDATVGFPNLWITDGFLVGNYAVVPPGLFPLAPPFPAPIPGLVGIEFDSSTGTLWGVDAAGLTANFDLLGVPLVVFPAPVVPPVSALTIDTTIAGGPFVPRLWLLDGAGLVNLFTGAMVMGYTFVGTDATGIGFAPMPNRYGPATTGPAGFAPEIDSTGAFATIGNATFSVTLSNAVPGPAVLLVSGAAADPPVFVPPLGEFNVDLLSLLALLPAVAVGPGPGFGGTIEVLALPPDPSLIGATVFGQWANFDGVGFGLSRGLAIVVGSV